MIIFNITSAEIKKSQLIIENDHTFDRTEDSYNERTLRITFSDSKLGYK